MFSRHCPKRCQPHTATVSVGYILCGYSYLCHTWRPAFVCTLQVPLNFIIGWGQQVPVYFKIPQITSARGQDLRHQKWQNQWEVTSRILFIWNEKPSLILYSTMLGPIHILRHINFAIFRHPPMTHFNTHKRQFSIEKKRILCHKNQKTYPSDFHANITNI